MCTATIEHRHQSLLNVIVISRFLVEIESQLGDIPNSTWIWLIEGERVEGIRQVVSRDVSGRRVILLRRLEKPS